MKAKIDSWVDNKVIQNAVVWVFVFILLCTSIQSENVLLSAFLIVIFISIPIYINNLIIVPYFYNAKCAIGVILFLVNIGVFTLAVVFYLSKYFLEFEWRMLYNMFGIITMVLFCAAAIKVAKDSFIRRQQVKDAELKLLKAQLNPHFLFNTLNNLYGLSIIKSDMLPGLMLKLSDLLRYSLYDTKERLVSLQKEIQYLENYVSLEKIRLEEKTDIDLQIIGKNDTFKIAPMLLIVFVENAFKHLGGNDKEQSLVKINIEIEEDKLSFLCVNSLYQGGNGHENLEKGNSGIGLANAKKRLELLYPEQHKLIIEKNDMHYSVHLNLENQ